MHDRINIDERWLAEWVDFGIREIQTYLLKHERFERYCERRKHAIQNEA